MYNAEIIEKLVRFIQEKDGIRDKGILSKLVQNQFRLEKNRSVFFNEWFAIRFCRSEKRYCSNTVLSLSALTMYDMLPMIICLVTPYKNYLMLANSTFLKKISQTSQNLRTDKIRGSFNSNNIMRESGGIQNTPENFEALFALHQKHTFSENLARLVEATSQIEPKGKKFIPSEEEIECINGSINRAIAFMGSEEYRVLDADLKERVKAVEEEILLAASIDNVNLRGRFIEFLITGEGEAKELLIRCLHGKKMPPKIFTADKLGDYKRNFEHFKTETDIKTKVLFLKSNPKGYNVDKVLSFLAEEKSVYLIFLVAIDLQGKIHTRLCSMYNRQILEGTSVKHEWAGRDSRGVTQFQGKALESTIFSFENEIDFESAQIFLSKLIKGEEG